LSEHIVDFVLCNTMCFGHTKITFGYNFSYTYGQDTMLCKCVGTYMSWRR